MNINNFKKLLFLSVAIMSAVVSHAFPGGSWKVYTPFDQGVIKVIDTPTRVYVHSQSQPQVAADPMCAPLYGSLHCYDKESDEIIAFNKSNYLSDNVVTFVDYNATRHYLLVCYDSGDIDMIFDDGEVFNIPVLRNSTLPFSKIPVSVTYDPSRNKAWLAMEFGYMVLDDRNGEVSEARMFNKKINAIAVVNSNVLMADDNGFYSAPLGKRYPLLTDFQERPEIGNITRILNLDHNRVALLQNTNKWYKANVLEDGTLDSLTQDAQNTFSQGNIVQCKNGYNLYAGNMIYHLTLGGNWYDCTLETADKNVIAGSWDNKEYWFCKDRTGLYSKVFDTDSRTWTTTREAMLPNSPSAFQCEYIRPTRQYGMLATNHGVGKLFTYTNSKVPNLLSGLKQGTWSQYGPMWRNPSVGNVGPDPIGLAVDPDDEKYVYSGSYHNGIIRLNLEDPTDIVQFSSEGAKLKTVEFHKAIETNTGSRSFNHLRAPTFDAEGNLWVSYPFSTAHLDQGRLVCWPAAERRAGNLDNWLSFHLNDQTRGPGMINLGLRNMNNRNLVIIYTGANDSEIVVYDHKGTLADKSDDKLAHMYTVRDQDGNRVGKDVINRFYEDTDGTVWACTNQGLFTFRPWQAFTNPERVSRIKVSRNDGTNLADYLLDNVCVMDMTADAQGRKWFATSGGGIVQTSADGKEILAQFTTDNSMLPSNAVYGIGYNSETNSILVSTQKGLAEYFPPGSSSGTDMDSAKIYPNPVRPDYYGYVTIEGLTDNALVKIVDSAGNLVAEPGLASLGTVQWDVADMSHKRVPSGVYFVLASSGPDGGNLAKIGKILVIN